ncbi:MAG: hypothetical protein IKW99_00715 [Bacteroidales bacterium]|nr:hypothetical protein [Bacteroidales bacterium]
MKKKIYYEAPEMEQILLKLEQGILTDSATGYNQGGGGSYGDGDTNNNGDY